MTKNNGKITITGDASDVMKMFEGIKAGFKGVEKSSDKMEDKVNKDMEKVGSRFSKATQKMKDSVKSFNSVLKAGATVFAVKGTLDVVKDLEKAKLGYEILKTKNKELADVVERTSEITGGLANKYEMVASANKALGFQTVETGKQFEDMMKVSVKMSQITGDSVGKIMEDLNTGVARKSIQILDNMQIKIGSMPALYKSYATSIGVAVEKLTEKQKTTALMNESLRQMKENTALVTDEMIKQNTRVSVSYKLMETNLRRLADMGVGYLGDLANASAKWGESIADLGIIDATIWHLTGSWKSLNKEIEKSNKLLDAEFDLMQGLNTLSFGLAYSRHQDYRNIKKLGSDMLSGWLGNLAKIKKANDALDLKKRTMVFTDKDSDKVNADYEQDLAKQKQYLAKKQSALDGYFTTINKKARDFSNIDNYTDYIYQQDLKKQKYYNDQSLDLEDIKRMKLLASATKEIKANNLKIETQKNEEIKERQLAQMEIDEFMINQARASREKVSDQISSFNENSLYHEAMALELQALENYYLDKAYLVVEKEEMIQKIKDKYSKKAQEEAEKSLMKRIDFEQEGGQILVGVTNDVYGMIIGSTEDSLRAIAGRALSQAGAKVYADGVQRVWVGGGEMLDPLTATTGAVQVGYGLAEIGAGLGMGYAGTKMSASATTPATSSNTENLNIDQDNQERQREIDNDLEKDRVVYLFPSERKWIMELQQSNKKTNNIEKR